MELRWKIALLFFATLILTKTDIVQGLSANTILLNDLSHFKTNRHHVTNPHGKEQARAYIWGTFTSFGLHTWAEQFKTLQEETLGFNIVGLLPGRLYKTSNDWPILIGAHYDTVRYTNGADDNGSGVVAMLQVARLLTTKSSRCTREYSVMFVAFDFEEWEKNTIFGCACAKLGCGSRAFVSNFSQYYDLGKDMSIARYGQLQGAIIMDTMMNYNSAPNSQTVPPQLNEIFPKQYKSIIRNQKRGDFLLATGRYTDDMPMLNTFAYYYHRNGRGQSTKYKLQVFPLSFHGQTSGLSSDLEHVLKLFLRSDHVSFWNEITSNRAIFLSDTADMRSYMKKCYHQGCDTLRYMMTGYDNLGFLSKSCDTIVMATDFRTKSKCISARTGPHEDHEGLTTGTSAAIGVGISLVAAVNGIALGAYYYRRRRSSYTNVLVNDDQLEEEITDDISQPGSEEDQPV